MNKKTLKKKLTLSKQTIANLNNNEMHRIAGGTAVSPTPIPPVPGPIVRVPTDTCPCPTNCAWMTSCHTCWLTCG